MTSSARWACLVGPFLILQGCACGRSLFIHATASCRPCFWWFGRKCDDGRSFTGIGDFGRDSNARPLSSNCKSYSRQQRQCIAASSLQEVLSVRWLSEKIVHAACPTHNPECQNSMDDRCQRPMTARLKRSQGGATSLISTESSITTGEAEPQYELAEYSEPS